MRVKPAATIARRPDGDLGDEPALARSVEMTPDRLRALVDPTDAPLLMRWLEPLLASCLAVLLRRPHAHRLQRPGRGAVLGRASRALLAPLDARAVVFSMQEPDGTEANDRIL